MIKLKILFTFFATFTLFANSKANGSILFPSRDSINGVFKFGNEFFYLNINSKSFYLKRANVTKFQDVVIPVCYDTIAKGNFKILTKNVISLCNDKNFHKISFDFKQEKKLSDDSIYFQVILPIDDAFSANRFRYHLNGFAGMIYIKSESSFNKVPKQKGVKYESTVLNFLIQDLTPENCIEEEKCYQRIYFRIFYNLTINNNSNYFTITLPDFNECYVERMDVENDFVFFDGKNSIFWHGNEYKRL
ncbi:MAG: hypothetical protein ABI472_18385 [Ginsengibacter sp.]